MEKADFTILSEPKDITFECPHCEQQVTVDFRKVDEPGSWSDDRGAVECPHCGEEVHLGDWSYD